MLREPAYLFYAVATSGYLLFLPVSGLRLSSPVARFFPVWGNQAILVSMPVLGLFSVLFARSFCRRRRGFRDWTDFS